MKPWVLRIIRGRVQRLDDEYGTARPTWRAGVTVRVGDYDGPEYNGEGEGKAAHVALNRACVNALAKAGL